MNCKSNKRLVSGIIVVSLICFMIISYGIFKTNHVDFAQSEEVESISKQPQIKQNQSVQITINASNARGLHDLTQVEWDGLKGIRGKVKLLEYIESNPDCTLSEAVVNVDGFGEKSAKIVDDYIRSINK